METIALTRRWSLRAYWFGLLTWLLCRVYFSSVRIVGAPLRPQPYQLIVCSHRNGAIDGYCVKQAFPQALFPLSVQLLRNVLLRLMFTGIPVVRPKDRERYGKLAARHGDVIQTACAHLRAGGTLAMFPEGSSEWGPHPLPYQRGTARIVRTLLDEGAPLNVTPLGLFYRAPDRFRSGVELLLGEPMALPARQDADPRMWERQIHAALTRALDAVSVNCPDATAFERIERLAAADANRGESYALAFKLWERQAAEGACLDPAPAPRKPPLWRLLCGLPGMALLAPVMLAGFLTGRKADASNTVTFFRIVGGFAMALLWLPILAALFCFWPLPMLCWSLLAAAGWPAFKR
jgi:1-acyl-sn-glycerol-3-phosphate acyltransferase